MYFGDLLDQYNIKLNIHSHPIKVEVLHWIPTTRTISIHDSAIDEVGKFSGYLCEYLIAHELAHFLVAKNSNINTFDFGLKHDEKFLGSDPTWRRNEDVVYAFSARLLTPLAYENEVFRHFVDKYEARASEFPEVWQLSGDEIMERLHYKLSLIKQE